MTIVSGPMDSDAGEDVVGLGGLQVHEHLAGVVVGAEQVGLRVDPRDPAPAAAVEGLHVHRVADRSASDRPRSKGWLYRSAV